MFKTPDLPYGYNALEPYIDEKTMQVHHDKHHTGYTAKLNAAIEGTECAEWPIERLLQNLSHVPAAIKGAVRNNGGGHYNHTLFWQIMKPNGGGKPNGELAAAIDRDLGGFDNFVDLFSKAAAGQFGSGWAWLALKSGTLEVVGTPNQDNPLHDGAAPLLGLDVWEHAYYLKYQNRRPEYIKNFFNVINWDRVAENFAAAK